MCVASADPGVCVCVFFFAKKKTHLFSVDSGEGTKKGIPTATVHAALGMYCTLFCT